MALDPKEIAYLCFEGGGAKGTAYLGALLALEEQELGSILPLTPGSKNQIKGISGASIGAIIGMCVGMGYDAKQINARLVKDRIFRILHAEPQREGMARSFEFKPGSSNSTASEQGITKKSPLDAFPKLQAILKKDLKKLVNKNLSELGSFFTTLVLESLKAAITDDKMFTDHIFKGAQSTILKNKTYILAWLLTVDLFQYVGRQGLEDLFDDGSFNQSVDELTNNQYLSSQFMSWLDSDPFDSGAFESDDDKKKILNDVGKGLLLLTIITLIVVSLTLYLQPKKFDQIKNKVLVLKVLADNIIFNLRRPDIYQSLHSLVKDLNSIIDKAVSALNSHSDINEFFEKSLDALFDKIIDFVTTGPFQAVINGIINDGGIFTGVTVRGILGELIQAKVEWTEASGFSLRSSPLDWSSQTSRNENSAAYNQYEGSSLKKVRREFEEVSRRIKYYEVLKKSGWFKKKELKSLYARREKLEPKYKDYLKKNSEREEKLKEELSNIMSKFTLAEYYRIFGVELCVTGTNTSTNRIVYFNRHITPNMPVVDAVGISSAFPFLFKPVRLAYTENNASKTNSFDPGRVEENFVVGNTAIYPAKSHDEWYREHYHGWFIDGGLLNNFPLHAFNAHSRNSESELALSPINMQHLPLPHNVFGLILDEYDQDEKTDEDRHAWHRQAKKFSEQKEPQGIISVVSTVAYGASINHSAMGNIPTRIFKNKQVVLLDTKGLSLFDLVPRESSLIEVEYKSYKTVMSNFSAKAKAKSEFSSILSRDNKSSRKWRRHKTQRYARKKSYKRAKELSRDR